MTNGPKLEVAPMNIDKILGSIPVATPDDRAKMRSHAEGWLATGTEAQREAAKRLLDALDDQEQNDYDELAGAVRGLTKTERVVRAFTDLPMTETETKLVQVLLDNPGITSTGLSLKMGWEGKTWHLHFGTMCKLRGPYLWPAPYAERRKADFYSGILADLKPGNLFVMKQDAVAAFQELGLKRTS